MSCQIFEIKGIVGGPNFCREYIILIYIGTEPEFFDNLIVVRYYVDGT